MTFSEAAEQAWREAERRGQVGQRARYALCTEHRAELVELILQALPYERSRGLAMDLAHALTDAERMRLLPKVLYLCSDLGTAYWAKPFVYGLPRQWVVAEIEALAEPVLTEGDELDWVNILDVYQTLDGALADRLTARMANHPDAGIRHWIET